MASWFDENFNFKEEPKDNDENLKDQDNNTVDQSSENQETNPNQENSTDNPVENTENNQTQSDLPKDNNSWYTPSDTSYSAGNQNANNGSTYHYGVNAPNPVPFNTNNYTQPQQPQYNSNQGNFNNPAGNYNQQGGYNPYGNWQRIPPQQPNMPPNNHPPSKPPKKKKGATIAIATLSVVCAAAIITLSVLLAVALNDNSLKQNNTSPGNTTSTTSNANAPALNIAENDPDAMGLSTPSIVGKNLDSTVVITVYDRRTSFYGGGTQLVEVGAASGIVMSADGYIITNWHVVINEQTGRTFERVDVKTYDGTVYENAEIIGADKDTDLAVLRVAAAKLSVPEFGDSSALRLGDKVVAIGNAGGLTWTTTQGIVSGLARDVYEDTGYAIKCLQVDAAINPGNSGGPLLNAQGQVVGVNSAKIVAQGYEGLGFSIPIKEAKVIVDDLVKYGYVKNRVMLGVTGVDIAQPGYEGFQIREISKGSCLEGTKAQVGDIITKIGNTTIKTGTELRSELSKFKVGDKVTITLMRVDSNGARDYFTINVTLTEFNGGR